MTQAFKDQMIGATELVRSGRLADAARLIQRTLQGGSDETDGHPKRPAAPRLPAGLPLSAKPHDAAFRAAPDLTRQRSPLFGLQSAFDGLGSFDPFGTGSAPAVAAAAPGGFETFQFSGPAGSRPYKLYVPTRQDGSAMPLVVMLHGCTQSPDDFAAGTRMNDLAEQQGLLVCYPGQTTAANSSKCWNWFNLGDQGRDGGEPAIIAGITRDVMAHHAVDRSRVYVAGLSAGGALAATMGQSYPDLYAGVAVHSGLACGAASDVNSAFRAMRQGAGLLSSSGRAGASVPTIVFHGDRDTTVNPVNGDEVTAQIVKAAALTTMIDDGQVPHGRGYKRTRYIDGQGRTLVEQWNIYGAGHAWSGGSSAGSYTDPQGPDASREMLRFFAEHTLPTP